MKDTLLPKGETKMGFQLIAPLTAAGFSLAGSKLVTNYLPRNIGELPNIQRLAAIGAVAVAGEVLQSVVEQVVASRFETDDVTEDFDGTVIDGEVIEHEN